MCQRIDMPDETGLEIAIQTPESGSSLSSAVVCPHCRASIGSHEVGLPCPDCGGVVDGVCLGCGYNLRGLAVDGRCPECGDPVERSLRGDLLRHADFEWLNTLYRGLQTMYAFTVFMVLSLVFLVILGVTLAFAAQGPALFATVLVVTAQVSFIIAYPLGWWWATRRDPAETVDAGRERVALRTTALLFLPCYWSWWMTSVFFNYSGAFAPVVAGLGVELWTHLCFALVWLHLWLIVREFKSIAARSRPESEKIDKRLTNMLKRSGQYVKIVPPILLFFHWIVANAILYFAPPAAGPMGARPVGYGAGVGWFWMGILWVVVIGITGSLLKAIKHERLLAIGFRSAT
ncbi:MAG: hypothetical protein ACF8PN_10145 [Phycisphaerales bacterium]